MSARPQATIKSHYSAGELAAMRLPGLPTSKVALRTKAEKEAWPSVEATGLGGTRRLYAPPQSIVNAIRAKTGERLVATAAAPMLPAPTAALPRIDATKAQTLKADARKGVLSALNSLMERSRYTRKRAATILLDMARLGTASESMIAMLKLARDERGRSSPDGLPSVRSILRFVEYERSGTLVPKRAAQDMSVPEWAPFFLGYYQRPEKPSVAHAYEGFSNDLKRLPGVTVPSIHQVRRFLDKIGNVTRETGRMGARELKTIKPFVRRGFEHLLPGDIYSGDGHTFDAEVQHPLHGRPFRPEITTIVDVATRKVVGWSVGLAESAITVLDAVRSACLNAGICAIFYVDNGSGYVNDMMTEEATGLMGRLGMEMYNSLPYNSQARGVIEKLHQTIWVKAAREIPGYMGRDMDREAKLATFKLSRKAIAAKGEVVAMPLLTWSQFVDFAEQKVAAYNDRPHRSLPKIVDSVSGRRRHMTPNEKWEQFVQNGFEPHRVHDDEAEPLFRPQTLRTVRRAELELFGNRYFNRDLEEFHGEQLAVGYDIHDPQMVWVYDDTGRFICTAELDANKHDYMPQSVIERARDNRAAGREKRLEAKLQEVREERRGTPALEQPGSFVSPGFLNITREQLEQRAQEREVVITEPIAAQAEVVALPVTPAPSWSTPTTPEARLAEWERLMNLNEEEIDSEKAKKWRHTYQETAEFRTFRRKTA